MIREKNESDRQWKIEKMALRKQEVELRKEKVNLYRNDVFSRATTHATRGDEKKQSNDDANAATTTVDVYGYDECIQ